MDLPEPLEPIRAIRCSVKARFIEHTNGIKTEYQSLGNVEVEVDDTVAQGDVIGTSGENEYDIDAGNHVHFKLSINNKYVDPTTVYQKATNTITN